MESLGHDRFVKLLLLKLRGRKRIGSGMELRMMLLRNVGRDKTAGVHMTCHTREKRQGERKKEKQPDSGLSE